MNLPACEKVIPAMSPESIERVRALESAALDLPQIDIPTHHVFHAGMYARTIMVPAGAMITGVLVQIPTVLVVCGRCTIFVGEKTVDVDGYHVFAAAAGRKQAFVAHTDTHITMSFATDAQTVGEAEEQFTAEPSLLGSRRESCINKISGG